MPNFEGLVIIVFEEMLFLLKDSEIAISIAKAFLLLLVIAKIVGPEPEIVKPSAPASRAAYFASTKPGIN